MSNSFRPVLLAVRRKGTTLAVRLHAFENTSFASWWHSLHLSEHSNIEFRIVLLHIAGPVLVSEFVDHGRDACGISDRNSLKFCLRIACINPNGGVLEHVLVPLCIRPLHWQQVKLVALQYEPDGD